MSPQTSSGELSNGNDSGDLEVEDTGEVFAVQEVMDGQIPIACAGYVGHQDMKTCPAETLMAMNLFLLNLQMMDKWRPSEISEKELQVMMKEAPRRRIKYTTTPRHGCSERGRRHRNPIANLNACQYEKYSLSFGFQFRLLHST